MKQLPDNFIFWEALLLTMFHTSFRNHPKKSTPDPLQFLFRETRGGPVNVVPLIHLLLRELFYNTNVLKMQETAKQMKTK